MKTMVVLVEFQRTVQFTLLMFSGFINLSKLVEVVLTAATVPCMWDSVPNYLQGNESFMGCYLFRCFTQSVYW